MSDESLARLLLRAIRYEHWLRYHFAEFPDDAAPEAFLKIPDAVREESRTHEPDLFPMLEAMREKPVSLEDTRTHIFNHVAAHQGVSSDDEAFGHALISLVDDPDFRRELDAFHSWIQETAEAEQNAARQPDATPPAVPSFHRWEEEFRAWAVANAHPHVTTISPFRR